MCFAAGADADAGGSRGGKGDRGGGNIECSFALPGRGGGLGEEDLADPVNG